MQAVATGSTAPPAPAPPSPSSSRPPCRSRRRCRSRRCRSRRRLRSPRCRPDRARRRARRCDPWQAAQESPARIDANAELRRLTGDVTHRSPTSRPVADRRLHVKGTSAYQTFTRTDADQDRQGARFDTSLAGLKHGCAATASGARGPGTTRADTASGSAASAATSVSSCATAASIDSASASSASAPFGCSRDSGRAARARAPGCARRATRASLPTPSTCPRSSRARPAARAARAATRWRRAQRVAPPRGRGAAGAGAIRSTAGAAISLGGAAPPDGAQRDGARDALRARRALAGRARARPAAADDTVVGATTQSGQ